MGLGAILKLTKVQRRKTRLELDAAIAALEGPGSAVLPFDTLLVHRAALGASYSELRLQKQAETDKKKAVADAEAAMRASKAAVADAAGFKQRHIDGFRALYDQTHQASIAPLKARLEREAPGSDHRLAVVERLQDNANAFYKSIRAAKTADEARKAFETAKGAHQRLAAEAATLGRDFQPEVDKAKNKAAASKVFSDLEAKILALQVANVDKADELAAKLYGASAGLERGEIDAATDAFADLETEVTIARRNNTIRVTRSLREPLDKAKQLRADLNGCLTGPQGKLDTVKGVLGVIGQRLDTLDLFLAGNETAESAIPANAMANDIAAMLAEVKAMDATKDKALKGTIDQIKTALENKKFVVFKGAGADAVAYLPQEHAKLLAEQNELAAKVETLRPSELKAAADKLRADTEALNTKALGVKKQVDDFRTKLAGHKKNLPAFDAIVKKDDTTQKDAVAKSDKFGGTYALAVAALEAALSAKSPDPAKLAKLHSDANTAYAAAPPSDTKAVLADHKKVKQADKAFADLKASLDSQVTNAELAVKEAAAAVKAADPGDELELKSVRAEVKRSIKLLKGAATKEAIDLALDTMRQAIKGAIHLKQNPAGDAPTRRGKLPECAARWQTAAEQVRTALGTIDGAIAAADNLDDAGKKEIRDLVAAARSRFVPGAFDAVVQRMTQNPSNENQPERMKAREDGLRLVRQFRDAIGRDPLITSLMASRPFDIGAFTTAHQALNDLDVNISRAV